MCLTITPTIELQTALEDIVVYKHVVRTFTKKGISSVRFLTSYRYSEVKLKRTYTSLLIRINSTTIKEGLHSFKSLDITTERARKYNEVLVECIIPKGSKYYLGDFEGIGESYASDTLKYVKVLNY